MSTFYYIAVSNLSNQRTAGKIDADEEKAARKELNKMGLAVLSISTEPFVESAEQTAADTASDALLTAFEFEALDQNKQSMDGTIEAGSLETAFDRLTEEFHFEVSYLCAVDADEATKTKAHADGIAPILAARAARQAAEEEAHRKTFMGSIEHLMKKKEGAEIDIKEEVKSEQESSLKTNQKPKKEITQSEQKSEQPTEFKKLKFKLAEKVVSKNESVAKTPIAVKPRMAVAAKTATQTKSEQQLANRPPVLQAVKLREEFKLKKTGWNLYLKLPQVDLSDFLAKLKNLFVRQPKSVNTPTEPGIQAETRSSVTNQLTQTKFGVLFEAAQLWFFRRWQKLSTANQLDGVMREIHRPAALARAWIWLADFLNVLAGTYLAYFLLMILALRYEWGTLSELAHATLIGTTLIPFLTFVLIFLRLLVAWRESLSQPTIPKTAAIFFAGALVLLFGGVNLLY
jgi:hypothetical protein